METATGSIFTGATAPISHRASFTRRFCRKSAGGSAAGPGRLRRPQVQSPGDHRDGPHRGVRRRDSQWPLADQGEPDQGFQPVRRVEESAHFYEAFWAGGQGPVLHREHALHRRFWWPGPGTRTRPGSTPDRDPGDDGPTARVGLQVPQRPGRGTRPSMPCASTSRGRGPALWTG